MAERTIAGRYELTEPLGSGWRARDTELERDVFVQLGAAAEGGAPTLAHPNIARIFDQGEADGERYAVSEYLPGGSLAERSDLGEEEALAVAAAVAAALAYAHAQGVAHGALGAENVLFDGEGRAKVAGFGAGAPEDDVRAFGGILESLAAAAPALAPVAAAALAGELAGAELLEQIPRAAPAAPPAEEQTAIQQAAVPPPPSRRGPNALIAIAAVAALAGGLLAAFLATSGDPKAADPTPGSLSVPIPTGSTDSTTGETTEAPPTTETTEQTTTAGTVLQPTTAPTTTAPPPAPTTAPLPTPAPPPTTEPPPPTTTEPPPPPTTETTPATTAPG